VIAPAATSGTYLVRFRAELDPEHPSRIVLRRVAKLGRPRLELVTPPPGGYLRERGAAVQGLIITHRDFAAQAETLAAFRRMHLPGVYPAAIEVVDIQDVLDEFSFGRMDPTALRNFLQMARGSWTGGDPARGPAYVCLLGDAHYDFRDLLHQGAKNFVPTYEGSHDPGLVPSIYVPQFGTDDFFGYLDGPGDVGLDLFTGRLPVRSAVQARTVVDKVVAYERNPDLGPWRGRATLVADDVCQGSHSDRLGYLHMMQTETVAGNLPPNLQRDKIYLYEFGTECEYDRKPAAAEALRTRANEGTLLVNFTGHGSEQQLADERVLETSAVPGLSNRRRPFLFVTASCSVGKYDFFGEGLGETLILYAGGGAISVFSACAVAYSGGNAEITQKFYTALQPSGRVGGARSMGQATVMAKAALQYPGNINSKRYILLGDPATTLAVPSLKVNLSLWNGRSGAALGDTLKRGVLVELRGSVLNDSLRLVDDFQGTASVRIYDSSVQRVPVGMGRNYELIGAPIYRGEVEVRSGAFSLRFQAPASLRTGVRGDAGIYVYVSDGTSDGAGILNSLVVPETEPPPNDDREGPTIALHFDGNPMALSPSASFTATLQDSSGINITGLVGSRSVVMQVENEGTLVDAEDVAGQVTFGDDYRTAQLRRALPAGLQPNRSYELALKASDNLRNSTTVRVPFTLAGSGSGPFGLNGVYNFPNPTSGPTRFFGRVSEDAEVDIRVFTLSGRRIWKQDRLVRVTPVQFEAEGLPWDGRDADGDGLANGVYLFKVSATPVRGGKTHTTVGRMAIVR
jgi:hypothetical protein